MNPEENNTNDKDVNDALSSVEKAKEGYDTALYLSKNAIEMPDSSIAMIMNLHDLDKSTAMLEGQARRENMPEVEQLAKKLGSCFDDLYKSMFSKNRDEHQSELLKKYAHNISSVIKPNKMILLLNHNISEKNLIGNKGANLVEMYNLGIKVPQSIFLTTIACKSIHKTQDVSFMPFLSQMLYMFNTDKIAVRSSGVVSMAGMMDTVLNIDITDENAIKSAILDVVNSWDSDRAKSFRKACKIDNEIKVAIVIQPVIRGDEGFSGICFSRNPNNGLKELTGEFLNKQFGDKIASGEVTPENIENGRFTMKEIEVLKNTASKLEKYFKEVQDIEFVNDGKETYFVQTRNAQLSPLAKVKTLIDFYKEGIISLTDFKMKYNPDVHSKVKGFSVPKNSIKLFSGTPAVNGIFTGKATFKKETATSENILIVNDTTPDDMPYMVNVGALITKIGGITSHPAVVCRQMNKPCIVGVSSLNIDERIGWASFGHTIDEIHEGDIITIVGDTGCVYKGKCEVEQKQLFIDEVYKILNSNG